MPKLKKFRGHYKGEVVCNTNNLGSAQLLIRDKMWDADPQYDEYETAVIKEYGRWKRQVGWSYYSMDDHRWHWQNLPATNVASWDTAAGPIKYVTQIALSLLGYKR